MNELNAIVESAKAAFSVAITPADLENAKAQFLGKSGRITELMKGMAALSVDEKKSRGAAINLSKQAIEAALNDRRQALADAELQAQLQAEALDVTLPGRQRGQGGLHPVSRTLERIEAIFGSMGFDVAQGPEIESDWFNFTALNTPEDHPARSMHDTFYVEGGSAKAPNLLRTHTSPVQVRHALQHVMTARHRGAGIGHRVVVRRCLWQAGERGDLGHRQFLEWLAEVGLGSCAHAIGALAEEDDVQVSGEDLLLAEFVLHAQRHEDLRQLAPQVLFRREEHVARRLHGDRARAVRRAGGGGYRHRRRHGRRDAARRPRERARAVEARVP